MQDAALMSPSFGASRRAYVLLLTNIEALSVNYSNTIHRRAWPWSIYSFIIFNVVEYGKSVVAF